MTTSFDRCSGVTAPNPGASAQHASRLDLRAKTLASYHILDTEAERVFDQMTSLVCGIFQAPLSTLTFLDRDRQWFKARTGIFQDETPLTHSLCLHAAENPEGILIIEDALKDERFWSHPAVTEDPYLRFYVGVPLIMSNGEAIGALCVADRRPRQVTPLELDALCCLRDSAVAILEARRAAMTGERHAHHVRHLQGLLPVCSGCKSHRFDNAYRDAVDDYLLVMQDDLTPTSCPRCISHS